MFEKNIYHVVTLTNNFFSEHQFQTSKRQLVSVQVFPASVEAVGAALPVASYYRRKRKRDSAKVELERAKCKVEHESAKCKVELGSCAEG